ncbi:myeloid differentiation primary response protein MyD88 [Pseudomyrmex gracilis]|uniref:myeloid differentiation primary response protein MyD88 n=1 Tax=Pseudomyrmex gracilis TaxID=219809 RepID=UPI0009959075|nr:myeloid differentiation primary response protein MyD88 [Pseudomyrmex gracilis]
MAIDLSTVPLVALSVINKEVVTTMLNPKKVLPNDNGLPRDWRGFAHLLDLKGEIMSLLLSHSDPTMHIFTILEKNKQSITMKDFQTMMEQMDRWDIIDDTEEIFEKDAAKYLEQQQRAQVTANPINEHIEQEILTSGDVHRINQGLETQLYDAFLLYADEDMDFANEIVQKLETEQNLKLFLKDRDLIGGIFEYEAMMKLISERCNRLLIVMSPNFLGSSVNKFLLNYTQALSIEKQQRKLIPIIYKKCELPIQLKYIFNLDYNRQGLYDFWSKLHDSIQASSSITTNALPSTSQNITEKNDVGRSVMSEKHSNVPDINKNISVLETSDMKKLNTDSKNKLNIDNENKALKKRWGKLTNWKTKPKQTNQLFTETVPNLPSVDSLDSLNLSSTVIYKNKKKNLFSKLTKKKIPVKA